MSDSSRRGDKFSKKKGGKARSSKTSVSSDRVQESTCKEDNQNQQPERNTNSSPLSRQVSTLSVTDEAQAADHQLVPLSGRENRQVFENQQQERVNYSSRYNRSGNNSSFYSVRGYSANSSRGQLVYFNCFTTVPLSLQVTPSGVNMDVPNGYMNNSRYIGAGNQGQGNQRTTSMQHQHMATGPQGLPGSAQTVNHGTNFFSFFFVNSGAYDLNFTGSGFPGLGGQPEPSHAPFQPPTASSSTGIGAPFPAQPAHSRSSNMYVTAGTNPSACPSPRSAGPTSLQPQPVYPPSQYSADGSSGSFLNTGFHHQGTPHIPRADDHFHHYRQRDPSYNSFSQRSMDNFDDGYEEEQEGSCSQCSTKSAPYTVGPNRFNGYQ